MVLMGKWETPEAPASHTKASRRQDHFLSSVYLLQLSLHSCFWSTWDMVLGQMLRIPKSRDMLEGACNSIFFWKFALQLFLFVFVQLFSHVWLCNPMDCTTPGFPVLHYLLELAQTHVHQVGDAFQPSHSLLSPSPPAFNLSQHQGLFQWVNSSHQVAKLLKLQFQHQSFQWIFKADFL